MQWTTREEHGEANKTVNHEWCYIEILGFRANIIWWCSVGSKVYTHTPVDIAFDEGGILCSVYFFIIQVVSYHRIKLPKTKYQASKWRLFEQFTVNGSRSVGVFCVWAIIWTRMETKETKYRLHYTLVIERFWSSQSRKSEISKHNRSVRLRYFNRLHHINLWKSIISFSNASKRSCVLARV